MRILLYEHITAALGGATPGADADSLHREGWAMRQAVAADLARIAGVAVAALDSADEASFRDAVRGADCVLVIAPEFDDLLGQRCQWVEECGANLLGPSAAAVRLTADKLALAEHWQIHGVPTPPTRLHLPGDAQPSIFAPVVCKPRHGAGSQAVFLVRQDADLAAAVAAAQAEGETDDLIVQPFAPGQAASVAWLIGPTQSLPLLPATQVLSTDGRFHYHGGQLLLDEPWRTRAVALSRRAVECVPGLSGYVGVDLVLGAAADGSADQVIELNPRLTTSYVGLRTRTASNLAGLMLDVVRGVEVTPPEWRSGAVRFSPDGSISHENKTTG